ncbi:Z1 domain-containing protein [Hyphobacterium sp. HN65]|uniref:Z1 domain-containing protein n=1 Tax=Hyphobacterium lacteum TaxID=3116575 RepID=A0ABU7LRE4_9PROT|nr:Z1 domain-containing protein [Hyphobacterium sp. HN65]MEE2526495.1 Z1 domain-containing protein [Hyphobacterium sp. HN65]
MEDRIRKAMREYGIALEAAVERVRNDTRQTIIDLQGDAVAERSFLENLETKLELAQANLIRQSEERREFLRANAILRGDPGHTWYPGPGTSEESPRWFEYCRKLAAKPAFDDEVIKVIDKDSTAIVSRLIPPSGPTDSGRGLVLGHVQSGKTANMMAVISKAADAGFKLVIVLAGLTKALRSQTQLRIDKDLIFGTENLWYQHTKSSSPDQPDQDFKGLGAGNFQSMQQQTQILVIKKNVSPLKLVLGHLKETSGGNLNDLPALIIDDECDQASINTAGSEWETTAINGFIREILDKLPRSSYVGYTATPFANVLIDPRIDPGRHEDLYPRDFVYPLKTSDKYFGPERLYGRSQLDSDAEAPDSSGLDVIRRVPDDEVSALRPARKDKETFEPELPRSLLDSLDYYLLAVAARRIRGQRGEHASMLVHSTLYTRPHQAIADKISEDWLEPTIANLTINDQGTLDRLRRRFISEFNRVDPKQFGLPEHDFDELTPELKLVAESIQVAVENMDSDTRLDYESDPKPKTYVVVGGSVLARGLTIEGLTVSYFTRPSTQFDTLLQMGRWFGYREGFEDLPRIWMTKELEQAFHDLATVEAEIRHDIKTAIEKGLTPSELAVRVRMIPGMRATAASKLTGAAPVSTSFAGKHRGTLYFEHEDKDWLARNWTAGERLIEESLSQTGLSEMPSDRVIRAVPRVVIERFLEADDGYQIHDRQIGMSASDILEFIREVDTDKDGNPLLENWNVAIVEPQQVRNGSMPTLGKAGTVKCHNRSRLIKPAPPPAYIKGLMSARDIWVDVKDARDNQASGWDEIKEARRRIQIDSGAEMPLLMLYAIDRMSPTSSEHRVALDAVADVLAVGMVFPDRDHPEGYWSVEHALLSDSAEEDEEFIEAVQEAEEANQIALAAQPAEGQANA